MAYIGNIPAESYASFETQTFTVSATASYTLSHAVTNENEIRLVINGVVQQPGSGKAYTASGTTLTLTSATVSGDVMYCVYLGRALQTVNPPAASVGSSQTAPTIITGQTAETSIATDDTILIHDTSASALRKMTRANFVSGIGGTNTPAFSVYLSGNVSLSNETQTKLTFDSEEYDSGSVFASNKFTPGVVGKYVINAGASIDSDQNSNCDQVKLSIYKNGSALRVLEPDFRGNPIRRANPTFSYLINVTSTSDYFEIYAYHSAAITGSGVFVQGGAAYTYFNGYKIIE